MNRSLCSDFPLCFSQWSCQTGACWSGFWGCWQLHLKVGAVGWPVPTAMLAGCLQTTLNLHIPICTPLPPPPQCLFFWSTPCFFSFSTDFLPPTTPLPPHLPTGFMHSECIPQKRAAKGWGAGIQEFPMIQVLQEHLPTHFIYFFNRAASVTLGSPGIFRASIPQWWPIIFLFTQSRQCWVVQSVFRGLELCFF